MKVILLSKKAEKHRGGPINIKNRWHLKIFFCYLQKVNLTFDSNVPGDTKFSSNTGPTVFIRL